MTAPDQEGSGEPQPMGLSKPFSSAASSRLSTPPKTRPFSIRLTDVERAALKAAAGSRPVGGFARERLLDAATPRKYSRRPASDTAMLSQILATLGRTGLSSILADLGAAAKLGTVVITPEMEAEVLAVCADIRDVKHMLLRGLGLVEDIRR